MKKGEKLIGVSLLTSVASSLCCITPALALLSGTSGITSNFSWLEPFRLYLIGFTILVLGFAWYQKLIPLTIRTKNEIDCNCEADKKSSFFHSNIFLGIVTFFAIVMTAFPYYSSVFYPKSDKKIIVAENTNIQTINMGIKGMTCASCEAHINHSVNQLKGILKVKSSYENGNAEIKFDKSEITIKEIGKAINATGYSVISTK